MGDQFGYRLLRAWAHKCTHEVSLQIYQLVLFQRMATERFNYMTKEDFFSFPSDEDHMRLCAMQKTKAADLTSDDKIELARFGYRFVDKGLATQMQREGVFGLRSTEFTFNHARKSLVRRTAKDAATADTRLSVVHDDNNVVSDNMDHSEGDITLDVDGEDNTPDVDGEDSITDDAMNPSL